ncbi:NADPH-dependent pterin aldehyde reductase-like isoform X2 [Momordica charantia]|uniref:NADPH-dependent pterin aldehyde reductase-like isoform X2 n=1 Tax=Momordica charantia TaxID=3673 RepID=A0A6J1DXF5_MOMCH|nr:NADPH-dependent pterin aldehyde reductase-like isoform X2 [Momordica charantia]
MEKMQKVINGSTQASLPPSLTILITGVSKGIGRALALEFAKRGHTIIGCSRDQNKLDSFRTQLSIFSNSSPDKHLLYNVDVTSDSNVQELSQAVLERKLVPDIIGVINKKSKFWGIPLHEFDNVIDTNVKGIANVLRHFIPLMIARNNGVIVNISSAWRNSGGAMISAYCASKWAVEGLTKSIAKELPGGMAIITLHPGAVKTDMFFTYYGDELPSKYQNLEPWAIKASTIILNFTATDNGASLSMEE